MSSETPNEVLTETARRQNQVLARLQKALNDKSLVIIVGAGVTLSATVDASGKPLPRTTWTGLVRNGLDYILEGDYLDASNRRIRRAYEALEDNDRASLLDAANTMKDLLVQLRQYPTWLESVFGSLHQEVRHPAIFNVLKALHEKGATLLTTNYDDLLERFCNLRRIGRSNTDDILKFKRGDLDGVFHIHGSYQDPHEVVLDTVNYYQVIQSDEVQNILKTFLEFKTVLFVGCGLGLQDPNFDALLRWASERQQNISNRHCLLIRNGDTLNYSPLIRLKYGPDYQDLVPYLYKLLGDASQPANVAGSAPTGVSREYSNMTEHSVASIADLPKHPEREPLRLDSAETSIPREPAHRALTHNDYTVGWICALAIEMAAAVGMLDKRHDSLPQDSRDHNNYVLGQIGPHNVAITCLPAGVPGVTPAARVASHMLSTFTSLRFGLMVGIGGGVPSQENDIRLGDVVVSQPTKTFGGVIQYDFGKTVQEGKFERTGTLNRPPDVLLRAVASLQAKHLMEEPALSTYLSEMGSKFPRLASTSAFPGSEHDHLFEATYDHPATEVTCANCRTDRLVTRTKRGDTIPAIHYGLIASGNQVMRDGKTRERLRSELQVLCFEMEAAGLMDDFPCLVIRGICDYADSHKNKRWQPYAAATAAAYAKELLNVISATQVVQTTAIRAGAVSPVHVSAARIPAGYVAPGAVVPAQANTVGTSYTRSYFDQGKRSPETMCLEDLFKTLAGDPLDIRAALVQEKGNRVPGTCQWILTNPIYKGWLASQSQLLWLSGGPGKGKTMFAIFLTQELERLASQSTNVVVTFFFCGSSYRRNTAVDVIRGILFRLLISRPSLYRYIRRPYEIQKRLLFADSSLEPLWDIFEKMIRDTGLETIYCVLDGLDECELTSLKTLLSKLVSIFPRDSADSQRPKTRLKLLCISREYAECILEKFRIYPRIKLDPDSDKEVHEDLEQYISVKVDELSAEKDYSEEVRSSVKTKLMQCAGGTFLWVRFAVKELMDRASTEVEEALDNFPTGLEELYSRMLLNVLKRRRHVVALILRWVVIATRPLTVKELSIVTGVKAIRVEERERSIRDYISFCGSLLTVVNNEVHLVHASARDYLTRNEKDTDPVLEFFRIDEREAHAAAAKLLLDTIQSSFAPEVAQEVLDFARPDWVLASSISEKLDRANPLTSYAIGKWAEHARHSCTHASAFDLTLSFFDEKSSIREAWWSMYRRQKYDKRAPKSFTPLHLDAYFGLLPLAEKLLERAKSMGMGLSGLVNAKDSSGYSPLFYAASDGCEEMVRLLCEEGAITEVDNSLRYTPLLIAISRRHSRVVNYLIEQGARVDSGGESSTPPLYLAASTGDEYIVKALLHHGANTEAESLYDKENPLHVAARLGDQAVIEILLDKGASLQARTPQGRTALHLACIEGQAGSARQLLANMKLKNQPWDAKDNTQRTALHCALDFSSAPLHWLYEDRRQTCLMILEFARPADVNAADKDGLTPLHLAVQSKDSDIVQKVLNCGGDHNARDRNGKLPVHHAASTRWWSNLDVIITLLSFINDPAREQSHTSSLGEKDANIGGLHNAEYVYKSRATNALQQRDNAGQTPLHIAAARGASHTVSLFLEYGVDVTIRDQENRTALDLAVRAKRQHTTEILSKRYVAVQLHEAARSGDIASLKEMLGQGQDPDLAGEEGRTPLHYAALYGHVSAVDMLLSNGATASIRDTRGQTALHLAANGGHIDVVQYLLRGGKNALLATDFRANKISVDDKDYGLQTPLHLAAYAGHVEVAKVLLDAGADINLRSASGRTPTHYAAHGNHRHLLELLIARGADIHATDNVTLRTPLQMATENFSVDAIELLQDIELRMM